MLDRVAVVGAAVPTRRRAALGGVENVVAELYDVEAAARNDLLDRQRVPARAAEGQESDTAPVAQALEGLGDAARPEDILNAQLTADRPLAERALIGEPIVEIQDI